MGSPTPRRAAPFFEIASQAPTSAEGEQQLHIRRPTAHPRRCAERPRLGPQRKASYVPITHNGEKRATLQYHTTAKRLRSDICGGRATAPYDSRRQTLAGARSARAKSELRSQNNPYSPPPDPWVGKPSWIGGTWFGSGRRTSRCGLIAPCATSMRRNSTRRRAYTRRLCDTPLSPRSY